MDTNSSDTWVLLAVLYAGGEDGKTLREVINTADYINHAIPTYEELAGGLARLLAAGLVVEQSGRYRAAAGVAARYDDLAAAHRRLWPVWDELERFVQVHLPRAHAPAPPPVISRAVYEAAVEDYIRRF